MASELSTVSGDQSAEELRRELNEAREQQAATAEILRAISGSPMDLHRVFADMAASAARLCNTHDASILQVRGDFLHLVAHHGPIPVAGTLPLTRGFLTARVVLDYLHKGQGIPAGAKPAPFRGNGKRPRGRNAICHLVAISMNRAGLPIALFTTNQWVTGETLYCARDTIRLLDRFAIDHVQPCLATNRRITAMLVLFRPQIEGLLLHRTRAG